MNSYTRFTVGLVIVAISLILVLACQRPPNESDLKASLGGLAEEYWTKRVMNKDYKATYRMEAVEGELPFSEYQFSKRSVGLEIGQVETRVEKEIIRECHLTVTLFLFSTNP